MGFQRSLQRKSCDVLDHASARRNGIPAEYWQINARPLDTARLILRDLPPCLGGPSSYLVGRPVWALNPQHIIPFFAGA